MQDIETTATETEILNDVEEICEVAKEENPIPKYYDKEWHDYVMKQFTEDELIDDHPTCDGLRRVTEKLIGPITERKIVQILPINDLGQAGATGAVAMRITVMPRNLVEFERQYITEECISDINKQNTEAKFFIFPLATCETRAESRALRKILRLRKVLSAEEIGNVDETKLEDMIPWNPESLISEEQTQCIKIMCSRLQIDVTKFINSGKKQYQDISEVTRQTAAGMLGHLNKFQRSIIQIPKNILIQK